MTNEITMIGRSLTDAERAQIAANASGEDVYCGTDADAVTIARGACDNDSEWSEDALREATAIARRAYDARGVVDAAEQLKRAADELDATRLEDGDWAYFDDGMHHYYVVTEEELRSLVDYLDSDDEQISLDAYSHWCAGTGSRQATPEQVIEVTGGPLYAVMQMGVMGEERFASRADAQAEVDRLNEAADEETGAEVLGDGAATVVECP